MAVTKSSATQPASVTEHLFWFRLESAVRQYGFVLLILLLLAGFCGVYSKGIFNNAWQMSADNSLRVDYQRFGRSQNDMDLKLSMTVPEGDSYTVTFSSQFMAAFDINALYPQPWKFSRHNGAMTLEFHDGPQGGVQTLWLSVQPRSVGKVHSALQVNRQEPVAMTQYIFP